MGDNSTSTINVASLLSFTNPVTLSIPTVPAAVTNQTFSSNPVTPTGTSTLSFDVTGGTAGSFVMAIQGDANDGIGGTITKTTNLSINYSTSAPAIPVQTLPANGATLIPNNSVVFNWNALSMASARAPEGSPPPFGEN